MAKPIVISILADAAGVGKGTTQAQGMLGRLGSKAASVAKFVGVAAAGAVVAVGVSAVNAASEAQQSIGATEQIYGRYADSVVRKSEQAAQAVGLSANSYRELSNGLGSMLKNSGTPIDELGNKTDRLVTLGADLASTFGGPTKDAVAAIGSLMRGEADPIERYGVSIKQSDVNARLAAKGLDKLTGQKRKEAEASARLGLLYEQTADAQGQFGRESSTLAGQQARLSAQWDDMKASLGTRLLPVLTDVFAYLNNNGPAAFAAMESAASKAGAVVGVVGDTLSTFAGHLSSVYGYATDNAAVIGVLAGGYATYKAVTVGVAAAEWALYLWQSRKVLLGAAHIAVTRGMTAAQVGLNAALRANPIGLVITAITLLVAGVLWAYNNVGWFRTGVQVAFKGIVAAGKALWAGVKWAFDKVVAGIRIGGGLVRGYLNMYVAAFKFVVSGAKSLYSGVTTWFGKVGSAVGKVKTTVVNAVKGAGSWLSGVGRSVIEGLVSGISGAFGLIRSKLSGVGKLIPGWLKKVLGINSPARKTIPVGFWSAAGVADGFIKGTKSEVLPALATAADMVGGYRMPAPAAASWSHHGSAARGRSNGGAPVIQVNVSVPPTADKGAVGRELISALRAAYAEGAVRP